MSTPPNDPYGQPQPPSGEQPWSPSSRPEQGQSAPWSPSSQPGHGQPGSWSPSSQPSQQPGYAQQGYGAPQQQWQPGAPGGFQMPPQRKSKAPLIIGIVAAVMVLVVVFAVVLQNQAANRAEQQEQESAQARVDGAAGAVQAAFDAIVAGDAAAALSQVDVDGNEEMLTNEVLAVSAELAPITDVVVTPPTSVEEFYRSAEVDVSYALGESEINQTFRVEDLDEDDTWLVTDLLVNFYQYETYEGLDIALNGAPVTTDEFLLFPGAYEYTTGAEYFTLDGTTTFEATDPYATETPTFEPILTDDGVTAFRNAVSDAVDACVSSKKLETGCGLAIEKKLSDGTVLKDGTLDRTLSSEAKQTIKTMKPTLSYGNWTLAQGEYIGTVDVVAEGTYKGDRVKGDILFPPSLGTPSIDMTDPELTVMWD